MHKPPSVRTPLGIRSQEGDCGYALGIPFGNSNKICGCPDKREWEKWKNSLSDKEWNKLVDEAYERECRKIKKILDNLKNKFNALKR